MTIEQRLAHNNFDLIRVLLASTVCLVHISDLSNNQTLEVFTKFLSSGLAVKAFFVISGFLIFRSYDRSSSLASYFKKRFKRIYPAYFFVILTCAFTLAPFSVLTLQHYFSVDWIRYVLANLVFLNFLEPSLPGVFSLNKYQAVNGALWTIKIEVMFYISVPLISLLFKKIKRSVVLAFLYLLSAAYNLILLNIAQRTDNAIYEVLARQLPGQLSYFLAGATVYYYLKTFITHLKPAMTASTTLLAINHFYPIPFLEPVALATVVIYAALFNHIGNFGKHGDLSYGIYILHFPIIQILLTHKSISLNPVLLATGTIFLTAVGALLLWHAVEKHALKRNRKHKQPANNPRGI